MTLSLFSRQILLSGEFNLKASKNNKFVPISCMAQMSDAQKIIDITERVSAVPDVMIL